MVKDKNDNAMDQDVVISSPGNGSRSTNVLHKRHVISFNCLCTILKLYNQFSNKITPSWKTGCFMMANIFEVICRRKYCISSISSPPEIVLP